MFPPDELSPFEPFFSIDATALKFDPFKCNLSDLEFTIDPKVVPAKVTVPVVLIINVPPFIVPVLKVQLPEVT